MLPNLLVVKRGRDNSWPLRHKQVFAAHLEALEKQDAGFTRSLDSPANMVIQC